MPSISKIRFTNVIYENGAKRYNDDIFQFDGYNGALVLENGGGKTVFIQTAIQAILPHQDVADRKIRESLSLEGSPCHVAIEWILNEKPRRHLLTAVTLFLSSGKLNSYRYVYEYGENDGESIENIPFIQPTTQGDIVTDRGKINEYYSNMKSKNMSAKTFDTIKNYHEYIESNYKIIPSEWRSIVRINNDEGGVEGYFDNCKTTTQLVDRLLIPVIEDSMSGDSLKSFSDIFEKQRERFKNHKQMRKTIKESKELQIQIDKYMSVFSDYNSCDKEFIGKQQYAKSIYEYVEKEKKNIDVEISKLEENIEMVYGLKSKLKIKQKSYDIAILKENKSNLEREFREVEKVYDGINYEYKNTCSRLDNLNIAKIRKRIEESKGKLISLEKSVEMLEDTKELKEIIDLLKTNTSKIYGHLLKMEEQLEAKIVELKQEHLQVTERYENEQKYLNQLLKEQKGVNEEKNIKNGRLVGIKQEMDDVLKDITIINKNETIVEQQKLWIEKVSSISKLISENETLTINLDYEKEDLKKRLYEEREELRNVEQKTTSKNDKLENIDQINKTLSIRLKEYDDRFKHIESIYNEQESITSHMERQYKKLNDEKEELLLEERKSGRFRDEYNKMDYFTVEPLINKFMGSWKNQFNYIETGTQYIQRVSKTLDLSKQEILNKYPYWSMAIIVEDKEVEKLKHIVYKHISKITLPIVILGENEANIIMKQGKITDKSLILPIHWGQNTDQEFFEKWKIETEEKVREITEKRIEKEREISEFSKLKSDSEVFFKDYSYKNYKKLKEEYDYLKKQNNRLNKNIKNKDERINFIDDEVKRITKQNIDKTEEYNNLNNWIKLSYKYIELERNRSKINQEIESLKQYDKKLEIDIGIKERSLKRKEKNILNLKDEVENLNRKLKAVRDEELYKEVKNTRPEHTKESLDLLKQERNRLKDIINENSNDLQSLNEQIKNENKILGDLEKDLENEKRQSEYIIDEELEFSLYGDEEIERALNDKERLEPERRDLKQELDEKEKIYIKSENELEFKREEYNKNNIEIIELKDCLHQVKSNIEKEEKDIKIKEEKIEKIKESLNKEKDDIESSIYKLAISEAEYEYKAEHIETIHLEESFYTEFPYNRLVLIEKLSSELSKLKNNKKQLQKDLDNERQRYRNFCNNNVQDVKLREKSIIVINQKSEYEEALKWQERMKFTIDHAINIYEGDIREYDKDLEKFIEQLVRHLQEITKELKEIPKKTKIKIENDIKQIYQFTIPEWKEEDSKDDIRKYIDKMTEELDKEKFRNEDHTENKVSIRREVEKWLDSKQLLRVALKDNAIKIKCRKVSNDVKVISGLNSWESSNRWSGGEKWSKNTTLLLGILNYIAEKRGGIIPGVKTSRTVIMDNPFGKASSDHVLDPVFLIAEKLGFQIIALTAHAEGSFIRNYFPVVYSCRLRESTNGETLIIDTEKELKHAFFKDKDPQLLRRIEERKQVSLFE